MKIKLHIRKLLVLITAAAWLEDVPIAVVEIARHEGEMVTIQ